MVKVVNISEFSKQDMNMEVQSGLTPFSYKNGEVLVVDELNEGSGYYIELNDLQAKIIQAVSEMLVANKWLITKKLQMMGVEADDNTIRKELLKLSYNHYLDRLSICNEDGTCAMYKAYRLGRKGKGFIRRTKICKIRMENYIETRNAIQIKKLLVANQVILGMDMSEDCEEHTSIVAKMFYGNSFLRIKNRSDKLFRAIGLINDKNKGISYFIQPLRNEPDNIKALEDKLMRMKKVLKKSRLKKLNLMDKIVVVISCETEEWLDYYKPIIQKYVCPQFAIALSYDRKFMENVDLEDKLEYIKKRIT